MSYTAEQADSELTEIQRRAEMAARGVRPVTIKQVTEAVFKDEEFEIDGALVGKITFVAVVQKIGNHETLVEFDCNDGSGWIKAFSWKAVYGETASELQLGCYERYMRFLGVIQQWGTDRQVHILAMREPNHPQEVYFHLLEALSVHLYITRGPPPGHEEGRGELEGDGGQAQAGRQGGSVEGLGLLERRVLKAVSAASSEEGAKVEDIARAVHRRGVSALAISQSIDRLVADGFIYSTVDDCHFKAAP